MSLRASRSNLMPLPTIAIIGRPNVGKSTLFNRLIGKRYAITSRVPGTTRDRIYHEADIGKYRAIIVDTGGMEFEKKHDIEADVQAQAKIAVSEADLIYFVVDATEPITKSDLDAAQYLRKAKKPVILISHKADNKKSEMHADEIYELGFGEGIHVSSIHNFGIPELEAATEKLLKKGVWKKERIQKNRATAIAIVGKPNVGKSSLVNALLGSPRLIVSEKPGTTIDATDTSLRLNDREFILIDTAGLRRRGSVRKGLEKLGTFRALRAITRCDVACLVIDWNDGLSNQDLHVSEYVLDAGKGLIVVVNKCDLMEDPQKNQGDFLRLLHYRMSYAPWAPVLFVSVLKRKNIFRILESSVSIAEERKKKISDAIFHTFTKAAVLGHPPSQRGRRVDIFRGEQTAVCPPTFTFRTNQPDLIHFSYRRYLENEIRRKFGFFGTAIKLEFIKG